jgi:hypothetical protein
MLAVGWIYNKAVHFVSTADSTETDVVHRKVRNKIDMIDCDCHFPYVRRTSFRNSILNYSHSFLMLVSHMLGFITRFVTLKQLKIMVARQTFSKV